MSAYFSQPCPTCGRTLQVRVQYLGRQITCRHCTAAFEACDPDSPFYPPETSGINLLKKVDQLLGSGSVASGTVRVQPQ